jgi:L-iditol 2-dehydrogenase
VAEQIVPCGECRFCRRGQYWMCEPHVIFGFKGGRADGGWAEYVRFPDRARVHRIDSRLTPRQAAYIEPLACAWHAVDRGGIQPGDVVVVAGAGNIGLCMIQAARRFDPALVVALDVRDHRLELALRLGADVAIDVGQEDAVARVRALTDGYGCDVYIEATGSALGPQQGLEMVRRLGTVVAFSVLNETATIDWNLVGDQKELNVHGSHLGPNCYPAVIDAIATGLVDVDALITHAFALGDFGEAMETARGGASVKTLLVPPS